MDSNHRRLRQLSYSQPHLATLVTARVKELLFCFAIAKVVFPLENANNMMLFLYVGIDYL